jgi:alkanesulfonate monooxygenase SsuD/methylene tetrahydromethanopterin reductase-like flavin-dependent oxidoreductase (luciferase family)/predicted kinase
MTTLPDPALVWLVGPAGSGKSTWASERFRPGEIVSSDALRAAVGTGEHDLDASADAFAALELIAAARLQRTLTTVIDTLGFDGDLRARLRDRAVARGMAFVAVVFDTNEEVCRARNAARDRSVPSKVLTSQFHRYRQVREQLAAEKGSVVVAGEADVVEPSHAPGSAAARSRQREDAASMSFFLHVSGFEWIDGAAGFGPQLAELAATAEGAGFEGISVMDHVMQIPQVGRPWEEMPEALTTLAYLAAGTTHLRLSPLVANVTMRPPALLAKIVATLDVLSAGRAECGLGAGWFEKEQAGYGIPFPPPAARLDVLEDTLRLLPMMWGPGAKAFVGKRIEVPAATCYPRPVQEHVPVIVGGAGRRTLRLAAELADGCNLLYRADRLEGQLAQVREHCVSVGRDPADVLLTVLDVTVCAGTRDELGRAIERLRGNEAAARAARRLNAGTVDDLIGRYRLLAEAGVARVYVSLADLGGPDTVARFAPVVAAFAA